MELQRIVTLWSAHGLTVTARRGTNDELVISGQDLKSGKVFGTEITEYEYEFTVTAADLPTVLRAFKAPPDADVLDLLEKAGAEVVSGGESHWLVENGVPAQFWSRMD
jgi:hypothetical protein